MIRSRLIIMITEASCRHEVLLVASGLIQRENPLHLKEYKMSGRLFLQRTVVIICVLSL